MLRSLSAAISALRNHEVMMDMVANNISNVNTTAFKSGRVTFQELFSQTLRGATAPSGERGGLNPMQVGLGMALSGIDTLFTQGNLQATDRPTDLAIQGDGFFLLNAGGNARQYTRDGRMDVDLTGRLVSSNVGMPLLGWMANPQTDVVDPTQPLTAITLPIGQSMARATTALQLRGNMDARTAAGGASTFTMSVYDSLGSLHNIDVTFTRSATNNQWSWSATTTDPAISNLTPAGTTIAFDTAGRYDTTNPPTTLDITYNNGATSPVTLNLDFAEMTQLAASTDIAAGAQNGTPAGAFDAFTVDADGRVVATFTNGLSRTVGQIALATFANTQGLSREGQSLFNVSPNSGPAFVGQPNASGFGQIQGGFLEGSNVDLAQQFTNMIIAQRGFQANSRIITASDEMLQDLVNLKR
ncbi:MAG: flagellar hook protein FlgE [Chloroflexi bacterium]|nr:flagellar hook protein FlgE [Chloroflexota bacterium]